MVLSEGNPSRVERPRFMELMMTNNSPTVPVNKAISVL
jgi:hypothetical protein